MLFLNISIGYCQEDAISLEIVSTTGQHFISEAVKLSWTIGKVMIENLAGNESVILNQGFQQVDLLLISKLSQVRKNLFIKIFPNPVS